MFLVSQTSLAQPAIRHANSRSCSCLARVFRQTLREKERHTILSLICYTLFWCERLIAFVPHLSLIFPHYTYITTLESSQLPFTLVFRCSSFVLSIKEGIFTTRKQTNHDRPTKHTKSGPHRLHSASRRLALTLASTRFEKSTSFLTLVVY